MGLVCPHPPRDSFFLPLRPLHHHLPAIVAWQVGLEKLNSEMRFTASCFQFILFCTHAAKPHSCFDASLSYVGGHNMTLHVNDLCFTSLCCSKSALFRWWRSLLGSSVTRTVLLLRLQCYS